MEKSSKQQIVLEYIVNNGQITAHDLARHFGITRQALYKHLNKLLSDGKIQKIGAPPLVYYLVDNSLTISDKPEILDSQIKKYIDAHYLFVSPKGEKLPGVTGFEKWCSKLNLPFKKTAEDYIKTMKKYDEFKKNGYIDGTSKLKTSFTNIFTDKLFYLDFYSIDRFGKTKLGQLLLFAKQSQDKRLISEIINLIKLDIQNLISKYKIDAIGFIPPTVKREVQFMKELERGLQINLPIIKIKKIKTTVIIPQKTLSKLNDRIENARNSIVVDDKRDFNNVLIIDDAVGSGATINETAKQLKKICSGKIIGLSIVGSYKGFDVISEV